MMSIALFIVIFLCCACSLSYPTAAAASVTTPAYYDSWCENNCSSLTECNDKYSPSRVDLRIRVKFPIDDGPGRHLVFDKYFGNVINRQTFETQFIFDVAAALETSPCRIYVLGVSPEGDEKYWDSENVFVTFRIFPIDPEAVASLTKQIQTPTSLFFNGKVTAATDPLFGLVALKWDFSLKLTYSISVIGGSDVNELPLHEKYLNQGSLQSCADELDASSLYCRFEQHFVQDMEQSLGLQSGQIVVLFMKEADRHSVIVSFRLIPDVWLEGSPENDQFVDWIESVVANLLAQIDHAQSNLYSGDVTFKVDPTWGVSGRAKRLRRFTQFLSRPIPSTSDDAYERCKAAHRCPRAWSNYNQTSNEISYTMQLFNGGEHKKAQLFLDFEDWRQGIRSWNQSCRGGSEEQCLPKPDLVDKNTKPLGAHWSPFDFESLGPSIQTYGKLWNSGLVLNQKMMQKDIQSQQSLIEKYNSLVNWLDQEYIHAITDDTSIRSREEIRANIINYTDLIAEETRLLETLSQSQCVNVKCDLLFNTSNAVLSGAVNAQGAITTTANGTEVAVWAFDSIDLDENVNVTLTGQRAMALLSRSSVRIKTIFHADPGTLGGFPGGFSVARRPKDRLIRVCSEQVEGRGFLDVCKDKSCCPGDQPISELASGIISNNVNGPGSPSSRVYLFTIQTSAPVVKEIQSLKTSADIGQTLSGGFRLHFNSYSTPFLSHDISARDLKAKMEGSLNPSSRLNNIDRSNTPAGIGLVEVTRERFGSSGG